MGIFGRLERLARRFDRWFGATAVASDVTSPGMPAQAGALGARVVAEEIEGEMEGSAPAHAPDEERTEESG